MLNAGLCQYNYGTNAIDELEFNLFVIICSFCVCVYHNLIEPICNEDLYRPELCFNITQVINKNTKIKC